MTVTGMDINKPGLTLHGQSSIISSNTGTTSALDFAALISMISNGQSQKIGESEGGGISLAGNMSISTEELVKKMLSSVILSDETIPELTDSELSKLSENKNLTEFAESFLGLLSQKSIVKNTNLPAPEFAHLQDFVNVDDSHANYYFSMPENRSLISSGSNLLLNLLINGLKQANDSDISGKIQNTVPSVLDKICNSSVLSDTNTKILSINYENVVKDLTENDTNVAYFVKLYANHSNLLDGSSGSQGEPNILNLQVNAKFSNDTDGLETKINVINNKDTSFSVENFVSEVDRSEENKPIILNIKDIDAVVAQFKLEFDEEFSLKSERANDFVLVLHQGVFSDKEVAELPLLLRKDSKELPHFDKFVDSDHVVTYDRKILPKGKPGSTTDPYVNLKFLVKNDLNLSYDRATKVSFTQLDRLDFLSDEFLQKLSDVQSGKFGVKHMNENLSAELVANNPTNFTLDQLKTPFTNFLFELSKKPSVNLKISTADILAYRNIITKPFRQRVNVSAGDEKIILPDNNERILLSDSTEKIFLPNSNEKTFLSDNLERPFDQNIKFEPSKRVISSEANFPNTNFVNFNNIEISSNRALPTQGQSGSIVGSLSLYDAQYSSRLGMLLTDNIIKGQEYFEIQLEPETFGKVRVSVLMENANLEVKMLAENSAAMMALRSSEAILQGITEQNGLKLSDYSVDMQNNGSNGERQGKNEKENNLPDSSRYSDKEVAGDDLFTNSETSHSLNLLA